MEAEKNQGSVLTLCCETRNITGHIFQVLHLYNPAEKELENNPF